MGLWFLEPQVLASGYSSVPRELPLSSAAQAPASGLCWNRVEAPALRSSFLKGTPSCAKRDPHVILSRSLQQQLCEAGFVTLFLEDKTQAGEVDRLLPRPAAGTEQSWDVSPVCLPLAALLRGPLLPAALPLPPARPELCQGVLFTIGSQGPRPGM